MVKKLFWACAWCLWITFCFFLTQVIVAYALSLFGPIESGDALANTLLTTVIYIIMLCMSFGGACLVRERYQLPGLKSLAGMLRRINWKDVGQALTYIALYFCALVIVMTAFQMLFPELAGEEQNLGYVKTGNEYWQLILIFVSLVIVVPISEELIMRGLLFGRLRSKISFWPTTIIVSLLFAVAHGQINVGIDVFILSLFLCYVREKTGAIYAPILMHSTKNLIGFLTVFIMIL